MKCHYEVFELERTASIEDIKKQYKKLALKFHPDRNHGRETEASEMFKEVATAYSVLSDPQERRWYDDHRESILRGGDGSSGEDSDETINLWPYFSPSCFTGFSDSGNGFYAVYDTLFREIDTYERNSGDINLLEMPKFGFSGTNHADVLRFYSLWSNFVTALSFSWEDKYNPNDAPDRAVRRAIEKDNKKFRDAGRKGYNELVRNLTAHVKKRDPRISAIIAAEKTKKELDNAKKLELKKEEVQKKRIQRELRAQAWAEEPEEPVQRGFRLADIETTSELKSGYSDAAEAADTTTSTEIKAENDLDNEEEQDEEEETVIFNCFICSKNFKSYSQMKQHWRSNLHKKKEQEVSKSSKKVAVRAVVPEPEPEPESESESESDSESKVEAVEVLESDVPSPAQWTVAPAPAVAPAAETFDCVTCSKEFKSLSHLTQHLGSKVHKKKEQEVAKLQKKSSSKKKDVKPADVEALAASVEETL